MLPLTIALHYRWGEGVARYELALVVRDLGEYSLAIALCEQALPIFAEINERLKQVYVLTDLIELYSCLGQFARAADYQAQQLTLLQHFKAPDAERVMLVACTILAHYQGNHAQAFAHAQQLWQLVQLTHSRVYQAEALTLLGQAQVGLQQQAAAAESYTQALTLYQTLGALAQAAEAQAGLAGIALAQGDHTQAQQRIEAVLTTLEQVPNAGLYEPFLVYLTCYRVLTATHDARARTVLQRAYALLQSYAAHIDEEDLRHLFLHNSAVHRQLVVTYEEALKADQGLPIFHTAFVGRQAEVAEIIAKLHQPEVRLLTLVGPGGMGKTRLAVEAAKHIATDHMPDGRFFVSLAGLSDPAGLVSAISASLGLDANGSDLQHTLLRILADRRLLLILDNVEQLLPAGLSTLPEEEQQAAVTLVMELLQRAPGIKILATSRQRLGLSSEHLYGVQGLEFAGRPNDRSASDSAAVRLFIQSAQRTQPHYQVSSTELATLLGICQLVQGMPLALEMAAAWVDQLALIEIAAEINKSIDFLATEWRDMPERQRSIRTVFAWSWQLLNPAERHIVRRIALFRGGFTRHAAQAVAGATLPSLTRLIHKSLLQWQGNPAGGGRYIMHELLRQFAAEELNTGELNTGELNAGAYATAEAQHGRYYLAFVAERGLRLGRGEPKEASVEIQTEFDNVRQAWQWAGRVGEITTLEPAIYGWWQFCLFRGLEAVSRSTFAQAIAGVRQRLSHLCDDQAARQPGERVLGKLLALYANMLFAQGKDEEMAAQAREAIALGVASGGVEGETFGSFVLGRALQELDQVRAAGALWQKTIQLARTYQTDHPDRELLREAELLALHWLRGYALHFDDFAGGRAYLVEALQLCQALGKQQGELMCNVGLAWTNFRMGDYPAAEQGFRESLHLAGVLGYTFAEMTAQQGLGEVARLRGDYGTALALLHQAARGAADIGYHYEEIMTLSLLIRLYSYLGDEASGKLLVQQLNQLLSAARLPKECHSQGLLAFALHALLMDDPPRALAYAQQAWQIAQTGDPLDLRADAAVVLGHTQAAMQQWPEATASYQQAIACYAQLGNRSLAVGGTGWSSRCELGPGRIQAGATAGRRDLAFVGKAARRRQGSAVLGLPYLLSRIGDPTGSARVPACRCRAHALAGVCRPHPRRVLTPRVSGEGGGASPITTDL
ncbi:MAG: NB-ARC domain-containing protein [Chloroflexi bacterium]|nr:NB-ARC domain-containing protein [Chloroflexota bacterium]